MSNGGKTFQSIFGKFFRDTEFYDLIGAERFDQISRRAECDHFPMIHDGDAIAETRRLFHIVSRQKNGAATGAKFFDDVPERETRLRIEPGGRLIKKQQLRIAYERTGNSESLFLTTREFADTSVTFLFQRDSMNNFIDVVT